MSYGVITLEQAEFIRWFVAGRHVTDLGAGDCEHTQRLLGCGATRVTAVDKQLLPTGWPIGCMDLIETYFRDFDDPVDVAFLSWPPNWACPGLVEALGRASTVIYLGKNTDGTSCGWPGLWQHLVRRTILAEYPNPSNTLIVYGRPCPERPLLPEEAAALDTGKPHAYRSRIPFIEPELTRHPNAAVIY